MTTDAELQALALTALRSNTVVTLGPSFCMELYYTPYLRALRPERRVISAGYSGQQAAATAHRWGAVPFTGIFASNQIPASGGVTVTGTLSSTLFARRDHDTAAIKVRVNGVDGNLTMASGLSTPVYTFTRDVAGSIVSVSNPQTIEPLTDVALNTTTPPSVRIAQLQTGTVIIHAAFNSISAAVSQASILADIAAMVAMCKKGTFLVATEWAGRGRLTAAQGGVQTGGNAADTATSKAQLDLTVSLNAALRAAYPNNLLDFPTLLKAGGYNEVFNVSGTDFDIVNTTILGDGAHPSVTGSSVIAGYINAAMTTKGF